MENVVQAVSMNPWVLAVVALTVFVVLAIVHKYTPYDVLAPIMQFGGMAAVVGLTFAAYVYGGWVGLGVLALLIVLR